MKLKPLIIFLFVLLVSIFMVSAFTCTYTSPQKRESFNQFPDANVSIGWTMDTFKTGYNLSQCNVSYPLGTQIETISSATLSKLNTYSKTSYFILQPDTTYFRIQCSEKNATSPTTNVVNHCQYYKISSASRIATTLIRFALTTIAFLVGAILLIAAMFGLFADALKTFGFKLVGLMLISIISFLIYINIVLTYINMIFV